MIQIADAEARPAIEAERAARTAFDTNPTAANLDAWIAARAAAEQARRIAGRKIAKCS